MIAEDHAHEIVFTSDLDSSVVVAIIYPESSRYSMLSEMFSSRGHAFLLHDQKIIVIDGATVDEPWFSDDHLLVIQAHELGHLFAGHGKSYTEGSDRDIEKEADWLGIQLLKSHKKQTAYELHEEEFFERYPEASSKSDESMKNKFQVF